MLSYIRLQNFKCFTDVELDLRGKKNKPKRMVFIYGENGAGKSNLISAVQAVLSSLDTITNKDVIQRLNDRLASVDGDKVPDQLYGRKYRSLLKGLGTTLGDLYSENMAVGNKGNLVIEIGFYLDEKEGSYRLELDARGVVEESLNYQINDRRGMLFSLSKAKVNLSPSTFFDKNYNEELRTLIQQYWGKHTFLSIMMSEFHSKNEDYLKESVSDSFLTFFNWILGIWLSSKTSPVERQRRGIQNEFMLFDLSEGFISERDSAVLDATEQALNSFFLPLYSDLKRLFYKKESNNDGIGYTLYVTKVIDGKLADIPFYEESTGTQRLLKLFPFIIGAVGGNTTLVDELDTGIHDVLVREVVAQLSETLEENDSGQIIATTHNTLLMDELPNESVFIISIDSKGKRAITPVEKYEFRTHANNSVQSKYLSGHYAGVPITGYLDFSELKENYFGTVHTLPDEETE